MYRRSGKPTFVAVCAALVMSSVAVGAAVGPAQVAGVQVAESARA